MSKEGAEQGFWTKYIFSKDHKTIGKQYLLTGLLFALIGGFLAGIFRIHLAFPEKQTLSPESYNSFVTMHGTLMVFWVAMPILIGALGNFCIPLMIGARDMAFPTLNMLSYWTFFISGVLILASLFVPGGAFAGGWTGYPPLSADPKFTGVNLGFVLWILGLVFEFASMLMGGINYITTTLTMRAKGMTLFRLPLLVWMEVIASVIFMLSVGPLIAGGGMLLLDNLVGTHFFRVTSTGKGDPILFQHLFWFFGHPEVYVILLPGLGVFAEIFSVASRKSVYGYKAIIYSTLVAGILSFIVWAHHMFVAGINPALAVGFSITTILISIPFFIFCVNMALTLWGGSIKFNSAFLYAFLGFIIFIVGGLTGLFNGATGSDIYLHDTHFVTGHFHYTLFSAVIMGMFAGIFHWFPKMFGRMMNETLGKIHAFGTFAFFNIFAFSMFFLGLAGHPRRYSSALQLGYLEKYQWLHHLGTTAAVLLILIQIVFVLNFFLSLFAGKKSEKNPWQATTLEWLADYPVPHGNWGNAFPLVDKEPYAYSPEGKDVDFEPQGVLKNFEEKI